MTTQKLSRRDVLAQSGIIIGAAMAAESLDVQTASAKPSGKSSKEGFRFCLNTATIRGQDVGIVQEIEIAAKAGYDAIEPWMDSIEKFLKGGGTLKELAKRIQDHGLTVESAIGFTEWIVDDDAKRAKGLERAKHEMEMVAQLGGKRIAAPPAGATDLPKLDLMKAAERYRVLLEAGEQIGVIPQLELWGFSKNLNRLGECVCVAIETAHKNACVLADVFHLYKGGSDFHGISLLGANAIQVLHMNDYPAEPPPDKIDDSFRVFPGDGVAPIVDLLTTLQRTGGTKILSLETFNKGYWAKDAFGIAQAGLAKMKAVASKVPR